MAEVKKLSTTMEFVLDVLWDFLKLLAFTIVCYCKSWYQVFVPPEPKSLAGEKILITGAANGIGREVCLLLAKSGATLICWDINEEANQSLERELKDLGCRVFTFNVDIADRAAVEKAAAVVKQDIGQVTVLINNAAIMPCHTFLGHNPRELERVYQINVLGQFWILREFLPYMIKVRKGHIVTTCSAAGILSTRHMVPYCGTKHAVHGYIEALKDELIHLPEKPDIKFTTVYPFSVRTALTENVKCFSRFPSLIPILTPRMVAEKLVDGLRRETEHVYIPNMIGILGTYGKILLPEVQRAGADFLDGHIEPVDYN